MNILEFIQKFPDEASCMSYFKAQKEQAGIICKSCSSTEFYWQKGKLCHECRHCHSRQSLRSGTVMENSKLPFRYWLVSIHLLTSTKKSFSTEELRKQLGHKRYQPIWEMECKIRDVMGKRDDEYQLAEQIELDDAFFTTEIPDEKKDESKKRGRGSQSKSKVLVMVESKPVENPKKGQKHKSAHHIKMQVIPDLKSQTITDIVKEQVDESAELTTDDSTSYNKLAEHVNSHQASVVPPKMIPTVLPWVHIAIANAKRLLLDVHHKIKKEYLQYYLNEFCYKFNRRYFGEKIFDRLVLAAVSYKTEFKSKIYNRTLCG